MAINILASIDQYKDGDDIWVFADPNKSKPLKKLDWYLNFQIHNSNFTKQQPTLISSHNKLPTKAILSIPFNGDIMSWCASINSAWEGLKLKSIRVFLPDNIKKTSNLNFHKDISTVNVVLG